MTDQPILFESWLKETKKLQEDYYHADYSKFKDDKELTGYIKTMFIATVAEMVELLDETSWKPWAQDESHVARDLVKKEAVDALHFIANILVACGVTDAELDAAYQAKMEVNRNRQRKGYKVRASGEKCSICHRALDDVAPSAGNPEICELCARTVVH